MASLSGVSSSNTVSSLMNSANMISGLASGLDTESMIENLVKSYQTKISQLNQKVTKTEWKQDAYRSIIQKMVGFSNKYTSYTSGTNLTSPSFFSNAVKVLTKGEYADKVSASGKTGSDISLDAVHQLARAAQYRTKSNMAPETTGTISGESVDLSADAAKNIELSNLQGSLTLTYGSKTVSVSFNESSTAKDMADIRTKLGTGASDAEVLAEYVNRKLADEKIVFNNGNSEAASERIKATANADGRIVFEEQGSGKNGVYISGASGNIAEQLGLSEDDLKNAKDNKLSVIDTNGIRDEDGNKGLTRSLNAIEYLSEKSQAASEAGVKLGMNISLDGSTKTIEMPDVRVVKNYDGTQYYLNGEEIEEEKDEDGNVTKTKEQVFTEKYTEALKSEVKKAFGDKVEVNNLDTSNKTLQLEFKVKNDGSDLVINTGVGEALGIGNTATSYLNTSKTLDELMKDKLTDDMALKDENGKFVLDDKGNKQYEFKINDVVVGTFTKDSKLSDVMNAINSSEEAGVSVAYSQTTQSFTFKAKETGADSKIELGEGLAQAMFRQPVNTSAGIEEILGKDFDYGDSSSQFQMKVGDKDINIGLPFDKESMKDVTMDELVSYVNGALVGSGMKASFDKETNSIAVTDSSGNKVNVEYKDNTSKALFAATAAIGSGDYTAGQDAKFTVTVNGEQKTMTRSSNSVNIDGLTINMNEEFDGSVDKDGNAITDKYGNPVYKNSVTFQSKTDSDKIINAIKSMVEDYNTMMSEVKSAYSTMPYQNSNGSFTNYEPLTDDEREGMSESAIERYEAKAKQGILFGDRNLSNLYTKMNQAFSFANTNDVNTLKDMGISVGYDISSGAQTVQIDEDKLRAMLDSDPDRVADLFTKNDGIMDRMKTQLDYYSKTTGVPKGILVQQSGTPLSSLSLLSNTWQKEIDNYSSQIEKWQDKLTSQVEKYTSQFTRLEQLIQQMNSQSSTLAGLMGG